MPVSYIELPYEQLLCHQAAYDLIDTNGREYFEDWDILEFEKAILGCGSTGYICNDRDRNAVIGPLASLDIIWSCRMNRDCLQKLKQKRIC